MTPQNGDRKPSLREIAAQLYQRAQSRPYRDGDDTSFWAVRLSRGLFVTLYRRDDTGEMYFECARVHVHPSPEEIAICRRDFDIPTSAVQTTVNHGEFVGVCLKWKAPKQISFDFAA